MRWAVVVAGGAQGNDGQEEACEPSGWEVAGEEGRLDEAMQHSKTSFAGPFDFTKKNTSRYLKFTDLKKNCVGRRLKKKKLFSFMPTRELASLKKIIPITQRVCSQATQPVFR